GAQAAATTAESPSSGPGSLLSPAGPRGALGRARAAVKGRWEDPYHCAPGWPPHDTGVKPWRYTTRRGNTDTNANLNTPPRAWGSFRRGGSASAALQALDQHRHAHAAGNAHGLDAVGPFASLQAVQERGHDARARHPEGVPQRDRPAERVELLLVDAQLFPAGHDLGGERLVDLDDVDVADRHSRVLEQLLYRRDRPDAHDLGANRRDRRGDDARLRREAAVTGAFLGHDQERRRPVVERAGVAGSHRAALLERRAQGAELLERRTRARAVVLPDHLLGHVDLVALAVLVLVRGRRHRHDLPVEVPGGLRLHGARLGNDGPFGLSLAADVVLLGHVLSGEAHRDVDVVHRALRAVQLVVELE